MMKESNRCRLGPQIGTAVPKEKMILGLALSLLFFSIFIHLWRGTGAREKRIYI